jgi:predicted ATP-binding protein involved in virulence
MTMLQLSRLRAENFRCFRAVDVTFEPDVTVLFAENGGGKTALLTAIAMALDLMQPRHTKLLALDGERDGHRRRLPSGKREPVGAATLAAQAQIHAHHVEWSLTASSTSRRRASKHRELSSAMEAVRQPGTRWPLLAFYGTSRFSTEKPAGPKAKFQDRWDGYAGALERAQTDGPFLEWLQVEAWADLARSRRGEPQRQLDLAVLSTIKRATPGVDDVVFHPDEGVVVTFSDGHASSWPELSDGFHVFMALVADIARRAVILNDQDGADAPMLVEGVVLVDEIDLHLHPRWQRDVLKGLRAAFPKLQFIVTTHSPQVLSSVENRQVRRLIDYEVHAGGVFVEGRDTNAILRELMGTDDRDERGRKALHTLPDLIDGGKSNEARALLAQLRTLWGNDDTVLIRATGLLDDE